MLIALAYLILVNATYFIGKIFYCKVDNRWIILLLSSAAALKLPIYDTSSYQEYFWRYFELNLSNPLTAILLANLALYLDTKKNLKQLGYISLLISEILALLFAFGFGITALLTT